MIAPNSLLEEMLRDNDLDHWDPSKDCFRIFDPNDTGYLDVSVLQTMLQKMGFSNVTDDEVRLVIHAIDKDNDGKVNIHDFAQALDQPHDLHQTLDDFAQGISLSSSNSNNHQTLDRIKVICELTELSIQSEN